MNVHFDRLTFGAAVGVAEGFTTGVAVGLAAGAFVLSKVGAVCRDDLETACANIRDKLIEGVKKRWNCKRENWVGLGINDNDIAHEVGCIHSIQGYDLSYAFVIIGNDIFFDEKSSRIRVNRANYFDKNGKNSTSDNNNRR